MKNSAWYYKLWLKKLSKLPLKEDSDSAWAGMKDMLDAHLPISGSGGGNGGSGTTAATKPFIAKLVSLVGYALPVAAAIGVATYLVLPVVTKPKQVVVNKKNYLSIDTINKKVTPVYLDSLRNTDTTRNTDSLIIAGTVKNNSLSSDRLEDGLAVSKLKIDQTDNKTLDLSPDVVSAKRSEAGTNYPINTQSEDARSGNTRSDSSQKPLSTDVVINTEQVKKKNDLLIKDKALEKRRMKNPFNAAIDDKKPASKITSSKNKKVKRVREIKEMTTPLFDFGLESGWNTGKNSSLYLGAFGSYRIRTRLLLNAGIRLNTSAEFSGSYITKSGNFFGNALSSYKVSDSRKVMVLNVPLTVEYRLSNKMSLNAGPVISFPLNQSNSKTQSEITGNYVHSNKYLDSVRHGVVDSVLTHTTLNKINLGITGGLSIRFNQFYIEGKYLQNFTPYKISNALGGYQLYYGSFQLGLRYKFKK